jgi:Tyrosine phosphatase family
MEANEVDWTSVDHELRAILAATSDPVRITRDFYLTFLEYFRENAAAGVRAVARAREGGVVVHCVGGKDRTGLLCAFLLDLAGVGREEIAADYAVSEERLRPRHEAWLAEAETEAERERIDRIARTPAEAMLGVLDASSAATAVAAPTCEPPGLTRTTSSSRPRVCAEPAWGLLPLAVLGLERSEPDGCGDDREPEVRDSVGDDGRKCRRQSRPARRERER